MKIKIILAVVALMLSMAASLPAQDVESYKKDVKKLSSKKFEGRGYYNDGVNKAAQFIAQRFEESGALPVEGVVLQPFQLDINTFHGSMTMKADGKKLKPGRDFVMREYSPGVKGKYDVYYVAPDNFDASKVILDLSKPEYKNSFVMVDWEFYLNNRQFVANLMEYPVAGIIKRWPSDLKFYKAYGHFVHALPIIWVSADFDTDTKTIEVDVDNTFVKDFQTSNVMAMVKGRRSDSVMVVTAHYDHLGHMGKKLYFPGANDNASGTAMLISLAEYYSTHQPEYDMVFIAFAGEETGLKGSKYFVENPIIPLSKIKYLINLDMVGDNGRELYSEVSAEGRVGANVMHDINARKGYFEAITEGELQSNSDHYYFAQQGVPAIFFIQMVGDAYAIYHTPEDSYKNAFFDSYEPLFNLIIDFVDTFR